MIRKIKTRSRYVNFQMPITSFVKYCNEVWMWGNGEGCAGGRGAG